MTSAKDANIVKIAVEMVGQQAQLTAFNQKQPLHSIIQELCNGWSLLDAEQYALQFFDSNNTNYITEKNRNEVNNGSILLMTYSPSKTANDILQVLQSGTNDEKMEALTKLTSLSTDITFALELISKKGLSFIIGLIQASQYKGAMLGLLMKSFVELMDHGIVSWDILEDPFISTVAGHVNTNPANQDSVVIQASLSILENIVINSSAKYNQVVADDNFQNLEAHIATENPVIQQNTLALINSSMAKADSTRRKALAGKLCTRQVKNAIMNHIIQKSDPVGAEMAHQLYVYQSYLLDLLEPRMNTKMDSQDQDAHEKIKELRKIAFDPEGSLGNDSIARRQLGVFAKDYKKLGFKSDINPALDFTETPPGMLALDCMVYFARTQTENYTKVVLENSCRADEHECPFGRTSVELVKLLCQLLHIGEPPNDQGTTFYPMFFTHDRPFEEFFCTCIVLLNKTWKEMRATIEDFVKVFSVVKEQITRALNAESKAFDKFRSHLLLLTYNEITNLWQQERTNREEWESHAKPIVQLKEMITPDIMQLIQRQRLAYLVEGTRFTKYSQRGQRQKDKFWYVRLSPSHKVFHYGDCPEEHPPPPTQPPKTHQTPTSKTTKQTHTTHTKKHTHENLPNKFAVQDINALVTGKDCPHMKDARSRKTTHHLAFSLTLDSEVTSLDFVAPDEQVFNYWTDGINALLGNKMVSEATENDLETLLSMDTKLRLLDTEGIDIPQEPPPIPDDPPSYDFCCDIK